MRQVLPGALTALYPLLFVVLWSTGFIGARFGLPDAEPLTFLSPRYNLALGFAGVGLVVALADDDVRAEGEGVGVEAVGGAGQGRAVGELCHQR